MTINHTCTIGPDDFLITARVFRIISNDPCSQGQAIHFIHACIHGTNHIVIVKRLTYVVDILHHVKGYMEGVTPFIIMTLVVFPNH